MTKWSEIVLGDWRNKGVALFFAATIWFVVFQSEKQTENFDARVRLQSADDSMIITSQTKSGKDGEPIPFDGQLVLGMSGPRKRIEELRAGFGRQFISGFRKIPRDVTEYTFTQADFGFPKQGVTIDSFLPERVVVRQEEVGERVIGNLAFRLINWSSQDYEISSKSVQPKEITVRGPKSVIEALLPAMTVSMDYGTSFQGLVDVRLSGFPDEAPESIREVFEIEPPQVEVAVALRLKEDRYSSDAVRVTFNVPAWDRPTRILVDELATGTIPVEFVGPKDRVSQLIRRSQDPDFSVSVRVPPFELEAGQTVEFTFTEESLELAGFPEIQMRPHASRQTLRRPWTYRIIAEEDTSQ